MPQYSCIRQGILYLISHDLQKTVAENSPLQGATHESNNEWLQNLCYHLYTRSGFYFINKSPLLSKNSGISELVTPPTLRNVKIYKKMHKKNL